MVPSGERRRIRSAAVDGGNQGRGTNKIPNIGPSFLWQAEGGRRGMDGASLRREKKGAEKNVPEMIKTALWDKAERGGKEERSWIDALFLQKREEKVT